MKDNVIVFTGLYYADVPPETVLEDAKAQEYKQVVIIGQDEDGNVSVIPSTTSVPEINWMIDHAKKIILEGEE